MGLNGQFWRNRRVFVTGHTGFKGGWLTLWLKELGADVTGFALPPPTNPSLFEAARVDVGVQSIIGDIRDSEVLAAALRESAPEIVLHLAAQPLVRESYVDPLGTFASNVMGTANLLNGLRDVPSCRSALIITSDKCYENREWEYPYRETDPLGGFDPYSSSKGCAEIVTQAFRRSYFSGPKSPGLCVGSARAGNVIGGGDWARDRLITDVVRSLSAGEEILIRSPNAERPWQHVMEPIYGYLRWAEVSFEHPAESASAWNFGPNTTATRPVAWLVDQLCRMWGGEGRWRIDSNNHPHEADLLRLDSSRAERHLSWHTSLEIDQTLQWTVDWFRAYQSGADMRRFTLDQIADYTAIT